MVKVQPDELKCRRNPDGAMRFFGLSPDAFDGTAQGHGYRTRPAYYRAYYWHCKGSQGRPKEKSRTPLRKPIPRPS